MLQNVVITLVVMYLIQIQCVLHFSKIIISIIVYDSTMLEKITPVYDVKYKFINTNH